MTTGYQQAKILKKVSNPGDYPLDVDGNLCSESEKKQAIYLLEGEENPDPSEYEVQGYFKAGDIVDGQPTRIFNPKVCGTNIFESNLDSLIFGVGKCGTGYNDILLITSIFLSEYIDYDITSKPAWINAVKGTTSEGVNTLNLSIEFNGTGVDRDGKLVLTQNETGDVRNINITQSGVLLKEGIPTSYPYVTREIVSTQGTNPSNINGDWIWYNNEYSMATIGEQVWMRENFYQPAIYSDGGVWVGYAPLDATRLYYWHRDSRYKEWSADFNIERFGPFELNGNTSPPSVVNISPEFQAYIDDLNAMFKTHVGGQYVKTALRYFDNYNLLHYALESRNSGETFGFTFSGDWNDSLQMIQSKTNKQIVKYNNLYYTTKLLAESSESDSVNIPLGTLPTNTTYFDFFENPSYITHVINYDDINEMFGFILGHNWDGVSELTDDYVNSATKGKTLIQGSIPSDGCDFWYTYPESLPRNRVLTGTDDYALSFFSSGSWSRLDPNTTAGNMGNLFIGMSLLTAESYTSTTNTDLLNALYYRNRRKIYLNEECGGGNKPVYDTWEEITDICDGLCRVRECTGYEQKPYRGMKYNKLPFELYATFNGEGKLTDLVKLKNGSSVPNGYKVLPHGFIRGVWMSRPDTYTIEELNKANEYLIGYTPDTIYYSSPKRNLG